MFYGSFFGAVSEKTSEQQQQQQQQKPFVIVGYIEDNQQNIWFFIKKNEEISISKTNCANMSKP